MRTTVEFPPALMRAAKARSAERGESLKVLLTRAVAAELGASSVPAREGRRVALPLFGHAARPVVNLSNADLQRALADADAAAAEPTAGLRQPVRRVRSRSR